MDLFENQLKYKIFFRSQDKKQGIFDANHEQMLGLVQNTQLNPLIAYFWRYLTYENGATCIDKNSCYLGNILYLDDVQKDNIDLYLDIEKQKKPDASYQGYAIVQPGNLLFLPETPNKVFDKNLKMLNRFDPDGNEKDIQEFIKQEAEAMLVNKRLFDIEGQKALEDTKKIAKSSFISHFINKN